MVNVSKIMRVFMMGAIRFDRGLVGAWRTGVRATLIVRNEINANDNFAFEDYALAA